MHTPNSFSVVSVYEKATVYEAVARKLHTKNGNKSGNSISFFIVVFYQICKAYNEE